jgi:hypothetical protein
MSFATINFFCNKRTSRPMMEAKFQRTHFENMYTHIGVHLSYLGLMSLLQLLKIALTKALALLLRYSTEVEKASITVQCDTRL